MTEIEEHENTEEYYRRHRQLSDLRPEIERVFAEGACIPCLALQTMPSRSFHAPGELTFGMYFTSDWETDRQKILLSAHYLGMTKRARIEYAALFPIAGKTLYYMENWSIRFQIDTTGAYLKVDERGSPVWISEEERLLQLERNERRELESAVPIERQFPGRIFYWRPSGQLAVVA